MLVKEIIQRIQSLYSKGVESDDSRLTSRHIYNKLLSSRSKLITQQVKKKQKISQWNYQTITCASLVEASLHECPCLPPIGCKILRTKSYIPKVMTDLSNHLIQSVTSLNGNIIYDEISWKEKKYKYYNKYTSNKPDYFIRGEKDKYIYITQKENVPSIITITALFEDPLSVYYYKDNFCEEEKEDCESPLDKDFPIDLDMVDTLVELTTAELVLLFSQSFEDKTNDSSEKITINSTKK